MENPHVGIRENGMTVGRLFFVAALVTLGGSILLIFITFAAGQFYRDLENEITSNLASCPSIEVLYEQYPVQGERLLRKKTRNLRCCKVIVYYPNGRAREHRYYVSGRMLAIDRIGDLGEPIRRTLFDGLGQPRVVIYYNDCGEAYQRDFLDNKGKRVNGSFSEYLAGKYCLVY